MAVALELGSNGMRDLIESANKLSDAQVDKLEALDSKLEEVGRKFKVLWGSIITHGMQDVSPAAREEEVRTMTLELARAKGLDYGKLVDESKAEFQRRVAATIVTGPVGPLFLKHPATSQLDDLRKEAIESVQALHRFPPGSTAIPGKEKARGARLEEAEEKERQRLAERLIELQDRHYLDTLSKEEQITELHRRRGELAAWLAANESKLAEAGRLKAEIDLEELKGQEEQTERALDKMKQGHVSSPAVNALQAIGAYTNLSPREEQLLDTNRRSEGHLARI